MAISDYEIGRVVAVDTAQVTIELNRELKALTRSTYEGTVEVGRINSYVIIPVGARRIVAMVTRVVLTEESELHADKTMVALPSSRRLMKATMIGTIEEGQFHQGISLFPVLDSPVHLTSRGDLDIIFGEIQPSSLPPDYPGYCIPIGRSAVFQNYQVRINPDAFFGKHAAVIGSTGSGKSCSIATILQSILEQSDVKQTRFIILDTNGEYRSAFQKQNADGDWEDAINNRKCLFIPTDPTDDNHLAIPYWFMNSEDFIRLFRAAPGVQRPVLINALSCARDDVTGLEKWKQTREKLIQEINTILSLSTKRDGISAGNIANCCQGIKKYLMNETNKEAVEQISCFYPEFIENDLLITIETILRVIGSPNNSGYYTGLDIDKEQKIEKAIRPFLDILSKPTNGNADMSSASADNPRYFSKMGFRYTYLENALTRDELNSSRARENSSTMLMRIYRLLEDSRFEFLFGPTSSEWPQIEHSLATFLRDILGMKSIENTSCLSSEQTLPLGQLPFYDRQRNGTEASHVVIVDLSLLASEVLENVTALIGRLLLEFLQRVSDHEVSGINRGDFPVVLILEEAQNYIKEHNGKSDEESISKQVFERIAREGRKFGLGLVVASQRPSELSKTVLSQCNSFIVHRLQNPEDLGYFEKIVPGIYGQLLHQLPALAPRMALVLGECVQAPALVEMREVNPAPRSQNPRFYESWVSTKRKDPNVEAVCAKWEGSKPSKSENHEVDVDCEELLSYVVYE